MKIIITLCVSVVVIIFGIAVGSVYISPGEIISIIGHKAFGASLPETIKPTTVAILWNLRLPRALLAFIAGGALSVSGAVMQSILRNPLASSYTLGVSSGASFGAGLVILLGVTLPFAKAVTLPVMGFIFGLGTIILVIAFASRIDGRLENNTIILTGMVFSLFISAVITLMSALARDSIQRLIFWQMGSFSMKDWIAVYILIPVVIAGVLYTMRCHRELDIMTFGEEQAKTMGINLKKIKWLLLILAAALTGSVIAFVGIIGFVDLIAVYILIPVVIAGVLYTMRCHRELDIMTFGEEQAKTMGINLKKIKWLLLILAAALTGSVIAFVGIIGFVDLIAPHIVRKMFGSSHRYVIPMSAVCGGMFMVVCDLAARTVTPPTELPVGAVTAIIGAPFFAYIYFSKR